MKDVVLALYTAAIEVNQKVSMKSLYDTLSAYEGDSFVALVGGVEYLIVHGSDKLPLVVYLDGGKVFFLKATYATSWVLSDPSPITLDELQGALTRSGCEIDYVTVDVVDDEPPAKPAPSVDWRGVAKTAAVAATLAAASKCEA